MRLPRRWPLWLICLLTLAGCMWVAWRIRAADQLVEEVYARVEVGSNNEEVLALMKTAGWAEEGSFVHFSATRFGDSYDFQSGYQIVVEFRWDRERKEWFVETKSLIRPTWNKRLQTLLGW